MNAHNVGLMIGLRYKLMWAKTRSRNGKIALFVVGYLLFVMIAVLLAAGGLGAAMLSIRSGKAELVAQAVLGGLYVQAIFASVMLGFGMNAVFTDVELRRYPLSLQERRITRHLIGIVDPFWFFILAVELGLGIGLCLLGDFNPALVLIAILLLFVSNYLLARIVGLALERLVSRKSGSALLMALIMLLAFLPGTLIPMFARKKAGLTALLNVLQWTPPFGAASAMTLSGAAAIQGLALVTCWLLGFAALLVYMEKLPPRAQAAQTTTLKWENPFDRAGEFFGPRYGPLMAFWFRFYVRNNRFRALYALTLPLLAFLTFNFRNGFVKRGAGLATMTPTHLFPAALGTIFMVSFLGVSRFSVNQYGYAGNAFRRFFLLPTDPSASMRAGSFASIVVGSLLIPIALVLWIVFGGPFDPRALIMLAGSAVTGLFALNGAGLWVTLYGPRKGNYTSAVGNDMSLMGNLVVVGGMLGALFVPQILIAVLPAAVSPENWWLILPVMAAAIVFYVISLRATGTLFTSRREALLAVVEGRVK